jgi:hypothetical protein
VTYRKGKGTERTGFNRRELLGNRRLNPSLLSALQDQKAQKWTSQISSVFSVTLFLTYFKPWWIMHVNFLFLNFITLPCLYVLLPCLVVDQFNQALWSITWPLHIYQCTILIIHNFNYLLVKIIKTWYFKNTHQNKSKRSHMLIFTSIYYKNNTVKIR